MRVVIQLVVETPDPDNLVGWVNSNKAKVLEAYLKSDTPSRFLDRKEQLVQATARLAAPGE